MTLRFRLACAFGLIAVALIVTGAVLLSLVRASLVDQIDRQLASAAPMTSRAVTPPAGSLAPPPGGTSSGESSPFTDLFIGQITLDGSLNTLLRPTGGEVPLVATDVARRQASDPSRPQAFDAQSADDSTGFRVVAVEAEDSKIVLIALPTTRLEATYRRVRVGVIALGLVLYGSLAMAGWWVERLGIRPIKRVTDAATAIAGGELEHRVEPQPQGTEAGQLADAFNIMADERQAAEQQLRQFVADASHELRTPLATVAGVLELQQSGALPPGPELEEALRRAAQETSRMSLLVSDLLLLASLDQGRTLDEHPVDLGVIVADAAFDAGLSRPRRTISTDIATGAIVSGDEQKLRQVVANLVSNAVAHTSDDSTITLRVETAPDECLLEIRDDGPGMTAEQAAHAFDRFYRSDTGRARSQGGSGLGLSIVASILDAHHGTISVETAPGKGATFRIALPRSDPEEPPTSRPSGATAGPSSDTASPSPFPSL